MYQLYPFANGHYTSYTGLGKLHVQQVAVCTRKKVVQGSCTSRGLSPHCVEASVKGCGKSFVKPLFDEAMLQYLNSTSGCWLYYCRFYWLLKIVSMMSSSRLLSLGKHSACILSRIVTFSEKLKSLHADILQCTAAYTCSNHVCLYSTCLDQ